MQFGEKTRLWEIGCVGAHFFNFAQKPIAPEREIHLEFLYGNDYGSNHISQSHCFQDILDEILGSTAMPEPAGGPKFCHILCLSYNLWAKLNSGQGGVTN